MIVFMISKINSEQQLKMREMELQNERLASKGQVIMDTISVEPVSMDLKNTKNTMNTSQEEPVSMDLKNTNNTMNTSQDLSPAPQTKWKVHSNKDARMGTRDVFHLHTQTTPIANLKNCLEKCAKSSECGAVITDNSKSLCWGKSNITNTFSTGNRIIYEKSEDGVLEPWNTPAPAPSPASTSNVSTNGRCGPRHGNKICPGKQCCSGSGWCAGTQGTRSAWCYSNKKGRDNGKYDGKSN